MDDPHDATAASPAGSVSGPRRGATVVAKLHVRLGAEVAFAQWQDEVGAALADWPGFVQQMLVPPTPPMDDRWTILQWFESNAAADRWLASPERMRLLAAARSILDGADDIHLARESVPASADPASMVIATRVAPEAEPRYREWQQKIAAVLAGAPGFRGYRFEKPVSGVRKEWLTVARFDNEATLRAWLDSPSRQELLSDAETFTLARTVRTVDSAFEQWLPKGERRGEPAAWKMGMLVLSVLYPTVFLLDTFLVPPLAHQGLEPWLTIFIGNVLCVVVLGFAVPKIAQAFSWWLAPAATQPEGRTLAIGVVAVAATYVATLAAFATYSANFH